MRKISLGIFSGTLVVAIASLWSVQCATRSPEQDAGTPARDGGAPSRDGGVAPDGGALQDGGSPQDGGSSPLDTTITQIQNGSVPPETCVRVQAVAMSLVFDEHDDEFRTDGGSIPRKGFYVSEKGIGTTAPRTGIEVTVNTDVPTPTVSPGDDLTIVGQYRENFELSMIRITSQCGSVTSSGTASTPQPATVTIAQIGQTNIVDGGGTDGPNAEDYEGVLVKITAGTFNGTVSFGEYEMTDGTARLLMDRDLGVTLAPNANDTVTSLTGFGHWSYNRRKIRPRNNADVVVTAAPVNCGSGPKADHLLITEVKLGPTAGEFVEIHNPTASAIDLSNYYLYNATYPGGIADGGAVQTELRYYCIAGGCTNPGDGGIPRAYWATASGRADFALRFPDGASIPAGAYQVVAVTGAINYCNTYYPNQTCVKPDYEIPPPGAGDADVPDMRGEWDNALENFNSYGFLTGTPNGEDLVLFYWDGASSTVKDVDYVIWGTRQDQRTSKTGVPGYEPDTAIASQTPIAGSLTNSQSFQRICLNEGAERRPADGGTGNGITGHDETSEDMPNTWVIRDPTPKAPTAGAQP
jgi:hypothetical protein